MSRRRALGDVNPDQFRDAAGALLVAGAVLTVLGFVAAEAAYPGYSTSAQTISALGAADAPAAAQTVFNATMVAAGALLLLATYALRRGDRSRRVTAILAITAVGVAGVGVFPSQTGVPHFVAAMLAFGGVGVAALAAGFEARGAFRSLSVGLGALELLALAGFVLLGDGTPLGVGGIERWVAYLGLLWIAAFGGRLTANAGETGS